MLYSGHGSEYEDGGRMFPPCLRPCRSFATHLSGPVPARNAHPDLLKSKKQQQKRLRGAPPLAAARGVPRLPRSACAALRPFHSRFAPFQGWEIPLPLQLLPPAFARWRSACMSHGEANSKATAKATTQGGNTHEHHHHRRSRHPVHPKQQQATEADRERSNRGQRASPDRAKATTQGGNTHEHHHHRRSRH